MTDKTKPSRRHLRGFGSMDPQRQKEIASQGGQTAHQLGRAHQWTREEAAEAGRKGGLARKANHDRRKAQKAA